MSGELAGKVAIVTGGASGIGRATVELFLAEGAQVVIADVQVVRGNELADALGDKACFKETNVAERASMEELVEHTVKVFGGLDILFNNAGVSGADGSSNYLDNDFSCFEKVMAVDLLGPMLGMQVAGRRMSKHGGGVLINTASIAGSYSGYGMPEYRGAKAGVIALTKSLAVQLGEFGVRVNSISPGPIQTEIVAMDTEMPADLKDKVIEASMDVMLDMQVLKRVGQAQDIAHAALFLASDRSAQITGIDLVVDGGASLGDRSNRVKKMEQSFASVIAGGKE